MKKTPDPRVKVPAALYARAVKVFGTDWAAEHMRTAGPLPPYRGIEITHVFLDEAITKEPEC